MANRAAFPAVALVFLTTSATALLAERSGQAAALRVAMRDMQNAAKTFGQSVAWEMAALPESSLRAADTAALLLEAYADRLEEEADDLKSQVELAGGEETLSKKKDAASDEEEAEDDIKAELEQNALEQERDFASDEEEAEDDIMEELEQNALEQEHDFESFREGRDRLFQEIQQLVAQEKKLAEQEKVIQTRRKELELKLTALSTEALKKNHKWKMQADSLRRLAASNAMKHFVPQIVRAPLESSAVSGLMSTVGAAAAENSAEDLSGVTVSTIIQTDAQGNTIKRTTRCEGFDCTETIESSSPDSIESPSLTQEDRLPAFPVPSIDDAIQSLADVAQVSSDRLSESALGDLLDGAFAQNLGGTPVEEVTFPVDEPANSDVVSEVDVPPMEDGAAEADTLLADAGARKGYSPGTWTQVDVTFEDGNVLRKTRTCVDGDCSIEVQEEPVGNVLKKLLDNGVKYVKKFQGKLDESSD